ncbi:hypothetical protein [Noviluteimonas dokdonensis]|nr:hypothetical protein [Lysobacter dokdonensis]
MGTQRQPSRSKSRTVGSQPAAQQSSPESMANAHDTPEQAQRTRERAALSNQGAQGRHVPMSLRENEDDDTATRH